jgi:hypothetical protein
MMLSALAVGVALMGSTAEAAVIAFSEYGSDFNVYREPSVTWHMPLPKFDPSLGNLGAVELVVSLQS